MPVEQWQRALAGGAGLPRPPGHGLIRGPGVEQGAGQRDGLGAPPEGCAGKASPWRQALCGTDECLAAAGGAGRYGSPGTTQCDPPGWCLSRAHNRVAIATDCRHFWTAMVWRWRLFFLLKRQSLEQAA